MTQTVPDISPLMPMHQDPLLVIALIQIQITKWSPPSLVKWMTIPPASGVQWPSCIQLACVASSSGGASKQGSYSVAGASDKACELHTTPAAGESTRAITAILRYQHHSGIGTDLTPRCRCWLEWRFVWASCCHMASSALLPVARRLTAARLGTATI